MRTVLVQARMVRSMTMPIQSLVAMVAIAWMYIDVKT